MGAKDRPTSINGKEIGECYPLVYFEEEYPTAPQMEALRRLVLRLAGERGIPASRIGKHNDYADTACPGDHLEVHLAGLEALVGGG